MYTAQLPLAKIWGEKIAQNKQIIISIPSWLPKKHSPPPLRDAADAVTMNMDLCFMAVIS